SARFFATAACRRHSSCHVNSVAKRPPSALGRIGNGASIYRGEKLARAGEHSLQTPDKKNRVHRRSAGRSGGERGGSGAIRLALPRGVKCSGPGDRGMVRSARRKL